MTNHIAVLKTRVFAAAAICVLAALASFAPAASATGVLDQSNLVASNGTFLIGSGFIGAESFTVGASGTLTDVTVKIDNSFSSSAALSVQIVRLSAGQADLSSVVGSGTIPSSQIPATATNVTASLTVAPTVVAGEQYAIVLNSTQLYHWYFVNTDTYAGGRVFFDNCGCGWIGLGATYDDIFATYVTPPPPPAPTAPAASPAARGGYCTVSGNTTDDGLPLLPGTFVNLDEGQAASDPSYKGATAASFVKGAGLTCAPPPAGYTQHGYATPDMDVDGGIYPYYSS